MAESTTARSHPADSRSCPNREALGGARDLVGDDAPYGREEVPSAVAPRPMTASDGHVERRWFAGAGSATLHGMSGLRARVTAGRLILDLPTSLPEGTEIDLVVADGGDELDDAERALLHESIRRSLAQSAAGETVSAEEVLRSLDEDPG